MFPFKSNLRSNQWRFLWSPSEWRQKSHLRIKTQMAITEMALCLNQTKSLSSFIPHLYLWALRVNFHDIIFFDGEGKMFCCSAWLRLKLNIKIGLHTTATLHHHHPPHKLLGSTISAVTAQIITVTTTYVQATFVLGTFVHISNISAVTGPIWIKL